MSADLPAPEGRILSTMLEDGRRRWLHPRLASGPFLRARRWLAYVLIAIFTLLPYLKINGKPCVLLDLPHREFTVFGFTFLSTDTLLLALALLTLVLGICLVTALAGRMWCGWMCPQTVYMEFVFRPLERLFDGPPGAQHRPGKRKTLVRTAAKYALYLLISAYLAHTFLAYFVGVDALAVWVRRSPLDHPVPFLVMLAVTGLMMFDFAYFREQTCIVACPYGRFQSVMLDRDSLIVSYDPRRGEPRGKLADRKADAPHGDCKECGVCTDRKSGALHGDCIDCGMCTDTCPTGIDIREGLQLECIACTQCIDACNGVMQRIGKPKGLIRLSSQAAIEGQSGRWLRPRVIVYPCLMLLLASLFLVVFFNKKSADITILQGRGQAYYVQFPNEIINQVRMNIENRSGRDAIYKIEIPEGVQARFLRDPEAIRIPVGQAVTTPVTILAPADAFSNGRYDIPLHVSDDKAFQQKVICRLLGPLRAAINSSGTSK